MTVNYLAPTQLDLGKQSHLLLFSDSVQGGASVAFVCRYLLNCTSIPELLSRIPGRRASGVCLNVASIKEKRMVNIELASNIFSVKEVSGFHR